jgi:hypothetical protein
MLLTPASSLLSTSIPSDITNQFLKPKQSRTSSTNSMFTGRMSSVPDRQSVVSMLYWDSSSRSLGSKKV